MKLLHLPLHYTGEGGNARVTKYVPAVRKGTSISSPGTELLVLTLPQDHVYYARWEEDCIAASEYEEAPITSLRELGVLCPLIEGSFARLMPPYEGDFAFQYGNECLEPVPVHMGKGRKASLRH